MAIEWYYAKGDQKIGPLTESGLKAAVASGDLTPTDLVWKTGATEWVPASRVKGLFSQPRSSQPSTTQRSTPPTAGSGTAPSTPKPSAMTSLLSTAKSAAQLAAKQAEKTKLTTITLPAQYQSLGKHCYATQQHRTEFPDLFQKLDAIRSQLASIATSSEGKPTPQSLGDKAKATAGKAMQAAQAQKLSMQQSSLFGTLGKAVYEVHGENSGPPNLTAPIVASLSRLADLDADISRLSSEGKGSWITPKRLVIAGAIAACLFVVAVVGNVGTTTNGSKTTTNGDTLQNVTATDLYTAFQSDPEAADKRFKGKWLAVSGTVGTRDNSPKKQPGKILLGLKGSDETDAYVACYFAQNDEQMLRLLDSTPQPPIMGKCAGAAQSEYAKAGQTLIEVQLQECNILPVASAQPQRSSGAQPPKSQASSPYDRGFSEGYSVGKHYCDQYKRLPDPSKVSGPHKEAYERNRQRYLQDTIEKMLETYDEMHTRIARYREQVQGTDKEKQVEDQYQGIKGKLEGYQKALRECGFSL